MVYYFDKKDESCSKVRIFEKYVDLRTFKNTLNSKCSRIYVFEICKIIFSEVYMDNKNILKGI